MELSATRAASLPRALTSGTWKLHPEVPSAQKNRAPLSAERQLPIGLLRSMVVRAVLGEASSQP
jgi:hypothetical protein